MLNAQAPTAAKRAGQQILSADTVRRLLRYEPSTGLFFWLVDTKRLSAGNRAGCRDREGYWVIQVAGKRCYAHRLAWLHTYGEWPAGVIDHRNGVRSDNRIDNLRDVSVRINGQNVRNLTPDTKSGVRGAIFEGGKFRARLGDKGRVLTIGTFSTAAEAHQAYLDAKRRLHEGCTV